MQLEKTFFCKTDIQFYLHANCVLFMKKWPIPLLAFFILLILNYPFLPYANSVIPGWHTTIYPPYFVAGAVVLIILMLVIIGYWLLLKRVDKVNWTLFVLHLLFTIPTVIYLKYPMMFFDFEHSSPEDIAKETVTRFQLITISWVLFAIGQLVFIVYFLRTMLTNRTTS